MAQTQRHLSTIGFIALFSLLLGVALRVEAGSLPSYHYGADDPIPEGWGVPWNMLSFDQELLLRVFCNSSLVKVEVGNGSDLTWR